MTDIINGQTPAQRANGGKKKQDEADSTSPALIELIELFFFAYRDFTQTPDTILGEFGFGRAHHRVLHFVNHYPGLRVADLLDILKITKQSLARVLKQLVDEGIIEQKPGKSDRRERRLFTTERGRKLARRLMEPQLARMQKALETAGGKDAQINRDFLYHMINESEHEGVAQLFSGSRGGPRTQKK